MATRQLAQASIINWNAKDLELQASLTPEERQQYGTYVLVYSYVSGVMRVLSSDDLIKQALLDLYKANFPSGAFKAIPCPNDLHKPGLYVDARTGIFSILESSGMPGSRTLLKDLCWMRKSELCRIAWLNGGMRICYIDRDGLIDLEEGEPVAAVEGQPTRSDVGSFRSDDWVYEE